MPKYLPTWLKLVRTFGDRGDGGAEVVGEWVGGGDGVVAGLDFDGAVAAGGADESSDRPASAVFDPAAGYLTVPRTAWPEESMLR
jgi:hypothetical protein